MNRNPRTASIVTTIAVIFHCFLPALADTGVTIEGTVEILCDPSRVSEVVSVQIRPVAGGTTATVAVDPKTGKFVSTGLAEGEYELIAIGADGTPLSPEPKRLLIRDGSNKVVLSMQPPGCGEPDADGDGVPDAVDSCPNSPPGIAVGTDGCSLEGKKIRGEERVVKDWHLTVIFFGVVGAAAVALDKEEQEDPASPF